MVTKAVLAAAVLVLFAASGADAAQRCETRFRENTTVEFSVRATGCAQGASVVRRGMFPSWESCFRKAPPIGPESDGRRCNHSRKVRVGGRLWRCSTRVRWGSESDIFRSRCSAGRRSVRTEQRFMTSG